MGFSYGISALSLCRPIKKHGMATASCGGLNIFFDIDVTHQGGAAFILIAEHSFCPLNPFKTMAYTINVNGTSYTVDVSGDTPLLWVLRDVLGLTGTKYGCGIEVCNACNVWIDGSPEKSCHIPVKEVTQVKITTIEGLSADGLSHPLQKAWIAEQVPQCGYCQSGMIMRAAAMVRGGNKPSDASIDAMPNICVCGTYNRIKKAIKRVANGEFK